ncbi:hypothetical protein AB0M20_21520 [Actinoplanes sp. NPDC051633]|uniref:hypothetical protein n=1 Tax=Actinoplanes sp. NPDC051633 TaxID=3155670 RepID=UPI00343678A7
MLARNAKMPIRLPAVWARLGNYDRADALARAMPRGQGQAWALVGLLNVVVEMGDREAAADLMERIEALNRWRDGFVFGPEWLPIRLAEAVARLGDLDRAAASVRAMPGRPSQAAGLAVLIEVAAECGDRDRAAVMADEAEAIAGTLDRQEGVVIAIAKAMDHAGDHERARAMCRLLGGAGYEVELLTALADQAARAGAAERARILVEEAEAKSAGMSDPYELVPALTEVAKGHVAIGDAARAAVVAGRAEPLIRYLTIPELRTQDQIDLAKAIAAAGDYAWAGRLADTVAPDESRAWARIAVIRVASSAGRLDEAERLAEPISDGPRRAEALTVIAEAATVSDPARARRLATLAEQQMRFTETRDTSPRLAMNLAAAVAATGDLATAVRLVVQAAGSGERLWPSDVADVARSLTAAGDYSGALAVFSRAADRSDPPGALLSLARSIPDRPDKAWSFAERAAAEVALNAPEDQASVLSAVTELAATMGKTDAARSYGKQAEAAAAAVQDQSHWSVEETWVRLATAIAGIGDVDWAERLVRRVVATQSYEVPPDPLADAQLLADLIDVIAAADMARATTAAHGLANPALQAYCLLSLAGTMREHDDRDSAATLGELADDLLPAVRDPLMRAVLVTVSVVHAGEQGDRDGTHRLADAAESLMPAIDDRRKQVWLLLLLARTIDEPVRKRRLFGDAASRANEIAEPKSRWTTIADVAADVATAGERPLATELIALAQRSAGELGDLTDRLGAWTDLAGLAADAGDADQAAALAERVQTDVSGLPDDYTRAWALTELAEMCAKHQMGDRARALLRQAAESAETVSIPDMRARLLAAMAWAHHASGDQTAALAAVGAAAQAARVIVDDESRTEAWRRLGDVAVAAGDTSWSAYIDEACRSADALPPEARDDALAGVAEVLAHAGEPARAADLAARIEDEYVRADAVIAVSVRSPDRITAETLAGHAETLVRLFTKPPEQRAVIDPQSYERAMTDVVRSVARTGRRAQAQRLAASIADPCWRTEALAAIGRAAAEAGDIDEARVLIAEAQKRAESISSSYFRTSAITKIAAAATTAGDHDWTIAALDHALRNAENSPDDLWGSLAMPDLATELAEAGALVLAETVARRVPEPHTRGQALIGLAKAHSEQGRHSDAQRLIEDAVVLIDDTTDSSWRSGLLISSAEMLAVAGAHDRAEAIANMIVEPSRRASALLSIAEHSEPAEALALTGAALRQGRWEQALKSCARLQPDVVTTIAAEVLETAAAQR